MPPTNSHNFCAIFYLQFYICSFLLYVVWLCVSRICVGCVEVFVENRASCRDVLHLTVHNRLSVQETC